MLAESAVPLVDAHDLIALDLDGVVYIGPDVVPNAADALSRVRARSSGIAFVTNNAARTPAQVSGHLRSLGVEAEPGDVVTSAQAAASLLRDRLTQDARVYVIGGEGLEVALREAGLVPVREPDPDVAAVVQGYGPEMPWKRVVAGAILVSSGLLWVASNMDATIPTASGVGPGNGALVDLVARFSGREPLVAGKPQPPLLEEVKRRHAAERPLFVGDRLDTDMAGAHNVGWPSLLVRTGVTTLPELLDAVPEQRPTFIAYDLGGLHSAHAVPTRDGSGWVLGGWRAGVDDARRLIIEGSGSDDDWWRCAATAAWAFRDAQGRDQSEYPQAGIANAREIRAPR